MAKHRRREQESVINENRNRNMNNNNNNPFGIDPMQLLGLLGGNFDMRNMSNMLASMNTNGFNLNNLGPLAQMAGLNLDNNFTQGNNNLGRNGNANGDISSMNTNNNGNNQNYANTSSNLNQYQSNAAKQTGSTEKNIKTEKDNLNHSSKQVKKNDTGNVEKNNTSDENLEFLLVIRSFVHQSKVPFVDKIIESYKKGMIK